MEEDDQHPFFQESVRERKWDRKKKEKKILMTVHKVNQISCQDCACAKLYDKLPFIILVFFTSLVRLDSTVKA